MLFYIEHRSWSSLFRGDLLDVLFYLLRFVYVERSFEMRSQITKGARRKALHRISEVMKCLTWKDVARLIKKWELKNEIKYGFYSRREVINQLARDARKSAAILQLKTEAREAGLKYWPILLEQDAKVDICKKYEDIMFSISGKRSASTNERIKKKAGWMTDGGDITWREITRMCSGPNAEEKVRLFHKIKYTHHWLYMKHIKKIKNFKKYEIGFLWLMEYGNNFSVSAKTIEKLSELSFIEKCVVNNKENNFLFVEKIKSMSKKEVSCLLTPNQAWKKYYGIETKGAREVNPFGAKGKILGYLVDISKNYFYVQYDKLVVAAKIFVDIQSFRNTAAKIGINETILASSFDHSLDLDYMGWKNLLVKYGEEVFKQRKLFISMQEINGNKAPKSLKELRKLSALSRYGKIKTEHAKLAELFAGLNINNHGMNLAMRLSSQKKKAEMIPSIEIRRKIEGNLYVFRKLSYNDVTSLALGELTNCCQNLWSSAASCVIHGWRNPSSGFYVIERNGNIVAQSWAWRGSRGELCFDSIEILDSSIKSIILDVYEEASWMMIGNLCINKVTLGSNHKSYKKFITTKPVVMADGSYKHYSDACEQKLLAYDPTRKEVNIEVKETKECSCPICGWDELDDGICRFCDDYDEN